MHLPEGILPAPVLIGTTVAAAGAVAYGLRRLREEDVPRAAVLSATFFVASLIHVPIGPASAHLVLNGLLGLLLGWAAFPAIMVALLLQTVLFGFGGLAVLGANTLVMGVPAVACHYALRGAAAGGSPRATALAGFVAGAASVFLAATFASALLLASDASFGPLVAVFAGAHVPLMLVEGLVTASALTFLRQVHPRMLACPLSRTAEERSYA